MSHGSNTCIISLWAMAQTSILLEFEPWLKPINYRTLSHGSNIHIVGLWAMAQTHQLLDFEPWLKPTFDMQILTSLIHYFWEGSQELHFANLLFQYSELFLFLLKKLWQILCIHGQMDVYMWKNLKGGKVTRYQDYSMVKLAQDQLCLVVVHMSHPL